MIRQFRAKDLPQIKTIYAQHNWTNYLKDNDTFAAMFKHSLATYIYEEKETIKGLVRVVGDAAHILYIQDILVQPSFLRQGIGTALMTFLLKEYAHIRQKVLITDKTDTTATAFYESLGFNQADNANITCYVHFT